MPVDMSSRAVTERLQTVSDLRMQRLQSADAVTRRLERVEQLRRLCLKLKQAGQRA